MRSAWLYGVAATMACSEAHSVAPDTGGYLSTDEAHLARAATPEALARSARDLWATEIAFTLMDSPWVTGVRVSYPEKSVDASRLPNQPEVIVEVARSAPRPEKIVTIIDGVRRPHEVPTPALVIVVRLDVCGDVVPVWAGGIQVQSDGWTRKDLRRAGEGHRSCALRSDEAGDAVHQPQ